MKWRRHSTDTLEQSPCCAEALCPCRWVALDVDYWHGETKGVKATFSATFCFAHLQFRDFQENVAVCKPCKVTYMSSYPKWMLSSPEGLGEMADAPAQHLEHNLSKNVSKSCQGGIHGWYTYQILSGLPGFYTTMGTDMVNLMPGGPQTLSGEPKSCGQKRPAWRSADCSGRVFIGKNTASL